MCSRTALLATLLLSATSASAQTSVESPVIERRTFRESIAHVRLAAPAPVQRPQMSALRSARVAPPRLSTPKRVVLTALAGFGGFYAGGVIGAAIDGECGGCDDPGLKGALIGMPIGTAAAAIVTWVLTGR